MVDDPSKFHLACACMAVHNMGHEPDYSRISGQSNMSLSSAVCLMAEQYMESDEHQDIFEEEARSWANNMRELTWDEAAEQYPTMAEIRRHLNV